MNDVIELFGLTDQRYENKNQQGEFTRLIFRVVGRPVSKNRFYD